MCGRFLDWARAVALAGATAVFVHAPARAADAAGFTPGPPGSQIMLYLSWPLGHRGFGASTFGLRYERATSVYGESGTGFAAALRHHSLIELQFASGAAPRMLFGPRVTWDMGRGELGPTRLVVATWPMAISGPTTAAQASWLP